MPILFFILNSIIPVLKFVFLVYLQARAISCLSIAFTKLKKLQVILGIFVFIYSNFSSSLTNVTKQNFRGITEGVFIMPKFQCFLAVMEKTLFEAFRHLLSWLHASYCAKIFYESVVILVLIFVTSLFYLVPIPVFGTDMNICEGEKSDR